MAFISSTGFSSLLGTSQTTSQKSQCVSRHVAHKPKTSRAIFVMNQESSGEEQRVVIVRNDYSSPVDPLARRVTGPKKVTRAAEIQNSMSFLDAWAAVNGNKIDVWVVIGVLTILVPVAGLVIGLVTGVIPGLYAD
mmetsp:Transcript_7087/g.12758  ORF Transcript_7087/g.12758 Transcript_7087/m.12758 type:complete len:136 (-) Transcript_7087:1044-1451(-)